MAIKAKAVLDTERLAVMADRGYFSGEQILASEQAGVTVTLPKPMTSTAKAAGRFGKQDFIYKFEQGTYRCPAGETLIYRYTTVEAGLNVSRYWTSACPRCPLKPSCTPAPERRVTRWEHEHILDAMQRRLDANPGAMRLRRQTVEHRFGTL